MNAVDRERERRDDVCPACGEGIDWEDGWHELRDEEVYCRAGIALYDVAVLDLARLGDF